MATEQRELTAEETLLVEKLARQDMANQEALDTAMQSFRIRSEAIQAERDEFWVATAQDMGHTLEDVILELDSYNGKSFVKVKEYRTRERAAEAMKR